MEEAIAREQIDRERERNHGTPAVLRELAEHIRRPRTHRICMTCRLVIFYPTVFTNSEWKDGKDRFAGKVCTCDNPNVVETVW
jgi:hypothetical protein